MNFFYYPLLGDLQNISTRQVHLWLKSNQLKVIPAWPAYPLEINLDDLSNWAKVSHLLILSPQSSIKDDLHILTKFTRWENELHLSESHYHWFISGDGKGPIFQVALGADKNGLDMRNLNML